MNTLLALRYAATRGVILGAAGSFDSSLAFECLNLSDLSKNVLKLLLSGHA